MQVSKMIFQYLFSIKTVEIFQKIRSKTDVIDFNFTRLLLSLSLEVNRTFLLLASKYVFSGMRVNTVKKGNTHVFFVYIHWVAGRHVRTALQFMTIT